MRPASSLTAVGASLAIAVAPAAGAGFGPITHLTQLGQPLNFTAVVQLAPDESLTRECVAAEVQSGDELLPRSQVRIALESPTASGERRVRVTTRAPIDEPIVAVTLTVGCGAASSSRRFVAFVDPPALRLAQTAPNEPAPPVASEPVALQPAPAALPPQAPAMDAPVAEIDVAPGSARARRGERPRRLAAAAPSRSALPSTPATAIAAAALARPAASDAPARIPRPRAPSGPRLQLEAGTAPAAAPRTAVAPAASAAVASVPTPAFDPASAVVTAPGVGPPAALPPLPSATPYGTPATAADTGTMLAAAPAAPAASASAASAAAAAAAPPATEGDRLRLLEESLVGLRNDARADRAALATLQARLQRAEAERYGSPLVYALSLASALLAVALGVMWRRQARARRNGMWWVGRDPGPVPSMYRERDSVQPALGAAPAQVPSLAEPWAAEEDGLALPEPEPVDATASTPQSTRPAPFVSSAAVPHVGAAASTPPPPRELSVEELIDLEQQVEFFVALGQDDAAIGLLMSHVRSDGGLSPLPYLKLLEIHRRRGDEAAYREIRERFNRCFNAYAPASGVDPAEGRSLVDYPETLALLQGLWPAPARAMQTLDAALIRRNPDEDTFDLPAYRELLLLYAVARDLAERAGAPAMTTTVDLPLPLDDPRDPPIARLSATAAGVDAFRSSDLATLPIDLDVSIASPGVSLPEVETVPSALRRSGHRPFTTESNFAGFDGSEPGTMPNSTG